MVAAFAFQGHPMHLPREQAMLTAAQIAVRARRLPAAIVHAHGTTRVNAGTSEIERQARLQGEPEYWPVVSRRV